MPNLLRRFKWRWSYLLWLMVPGLLWWSLRDIRLGAIAAVLGRLQFWQVLTLVAVNALIPAAFAARYWVIVRAYGYSIPYLALTRQRVAVFGLSYFTPSLQFGGEPLQVYVAARDHGVPGPVAVAATTLDKLIELLINFAVLAVGALVMLQQRMFVGVSSLAVVGPVFATLAGAVLFCGVVWRGGQPLSGILRRLPVGWRRRPALARALSSLDGAERQAVIFFQRRPADFLWAVLATLMSWVLILIEYWLGVAFLGIALTPAQLLAVVTLNRLAFLVPVPAGLGALESSLVLAFTALGLDPAVGLGHGLIIRVRDVGLGLLGLVWAGQYMTVDPARHQPAPATLSENRDG